MRVLYYSTAYYALHGGSNHSKAFVKFVKEHPSVSEIRVYPTSDLSSNINTNDKILLRRKFFPEIASFKLLLPLRLYRRNQQNLEGLYKELLSFEPDVLVVRLDNNFLQLNKIKKKFPNITLVTEINASPFDESFKHIQLKSFFQKKEREAYAECDLNFFISSFLRKKIMGTKVSLERDFVNHNGFDDTIFNAIKDITVRERILRIPNTYNVIGYVGTLDYHKQMPLFIDAFATVKNKYKNTVALIVGGGPAFDVIKNIVAEKGLSDCFYFTGQIDHDQVHHYLKAFDIAVHHAANDYMSPLKVFEYLAVKLPVIAPDIPAVREIFEDGKHLLLTKPTAQDIANKLILLLSKPEVAEEIADTGHKYVNLNFSWRINVNNIIQAVLKIKNIEGHTASAKAST